MLTDRFTCGVDYVHIAHAAQVRKGSDISYLTHLLGVAALVIEFGGYEDQVIAGLLHDTLEDCGAHHEPIIRAQFGDVVAVIVLVCTDGTAEDKSSLLDAEAKRRDWLARKLTYLAHLAEAPDTVLLVPGCDKLHNARAIVQDLEDPNAGLSVFDRFKSGQAGTLAYYKSLSSIFLARQAKTANVFDAVVERMHGLAGGVRRERLTA